MERKEVIKIFNEVLLFGKARCTQTEFKELAKMSIQALEQEPITNNDLALIHTYGLDEGIRCAMCTNSMRSDRGCDGGCVVNNAMYKKVMDVIENHIVDIDKMVEPTTKNDLGVECKTEDFISRKQAQDELYWKCQRWSLSKASNGFGQDVWNDYMISSKDAMQVLKDLPSVYPKSDNSVLEDINKMLAEINGEIACAEYHEVECNHKTEKQDGRRVIAKIVHEYCDKYMESE